MTDLVPPDPSPVTERPRRGRPKAYRLEYCELIIAFMSAGHTMTAFAAEIGVARSTVLRWAEKHQEFQDALKVAQAAAAKWWEERLRDVAISGQGNATAAIFALKNMAPDDWRDTRRLEHDGVADAPVAISDTETVRRLAFLLDQARDRANPQGSGDSRRG